MAFIDLQRIAAESTQGKTASGRVQELTKKKTAELQDKTKSLQSNQQKLQQGGSVLNEAARAQAQKEIDRLTVEIDRFQEDANAEVQELQQQLQAEFQESSGRSSTRWSRNSPSGCCSAMATPARST